MRIIKSELFGKILIQVKSALADTPKGRSFLMSWDDNQIKREMRDPVFFGVKTPIRKVDHAITHFKKIAGVSHD